jgi:hypothetical protein
MEGIVIIDWDEFEGGVISFKYPEIKVPDNLVQLLQISHSFNPGLINIQENDFHAVSIGNERLQKVIVFILSKFEDASDFDELIHMVNKIVSDISEEAHLAKEIKHVFFLSQTVFKAREAVLTKLANEVTDLKNREVDCKLSLEWLIKNEPLIKKQVILYLMRSGPSNFTDLKKFLNCQEKSLLEILKEMENEKLLDPREENGEIFFHLLIHYLV